MVCHSRLGNFTEICNFIINFVIKIVRHDDDDNSYSYLTASIGRNSILNYKSIHFKFMVQNCVTRYQPH